MLLCRRVLHFVNDGIKRSALKAGFHMIGDDRGSRIADRKKFCDRLRSYGNTLLRSSAIVCDQLRSCDHMEIKVLRSAIQTYPIIFWIPTHDSTLLSNKARIFACSNRLFVVNMAGVEQGNVSCEELWRNLRDMSAFTTVTVKISDTKAKRLTSGKKKSERNLIYKRWRRRPNSAT